MSVLLVLGTVLLVLVSVFMVLVILAQRAKSDGGVGAALGGGVTEAAFGAESGNVLSKATTIATIIFFLLSLFLYLGHLNRGDSAANRGELPASPELLPAPEAPAAPGPDGTTTPGVTPGPAPEAGGTPSTEAPPAAAPEAEVPAVPPPPAAEVPAPQDATAPAAPANP